MAKEDKISVGIEADARGLINTLERIEQVIHNTMNEIAKNAINLKVDEQRLKKNIDEAVNTIKKRIKKDSGLDVDLKIDTKKLGDEIAKSLRKIKGTTDVDVGVNEKAITKAVERAIKNSKVSISPDVVTPKKIKVPSQKDEPPSRNAKELNQIKKYSQQYLESRNILDKHFGEGKEVFKSTKELEKQLSLMNKAANKLQELKVKNSELSSAQLPGNINALKSQAKAYLGKNYNVNKTTKELLKDMGLDDKLIKEAEKWVKQWNNALNNIGEHQGKYGKKYKNTSEFSDVRRQLQQAKGKLLDLVHESKNLKTLGIDTSILAPGKNQLNYTKVNIKKQTNVEPAVEQIKENTKKVVKELQAGSKELEAAWDKYDAELAHKKSQEMDRGFRTMERARRSAEIRAMNKPYKEDADKFFAIPEVDKKLTKEDILKNMGLDQNKIKYAISLINELDKAVDKLNLHLGGKPFTNLEEYQSFFDKAKKLKKDLHDLIGDNKNNTKLKELGIDTSIFGITKAGNSKNMVFDETLDQRNHRIAEEKRKAEEQAQKESKEANERNLAQIQKLKQEILSLASSYDTLRQKVNAYKEEGKNLTKIQRLGFENQENKLRKQLTDKLTQYRGLGGKENLNINTTKTNYDSVQNSINKQRELNSLLSSAETLLKDINKHNISTGTVDYKNTEIATKKLNEYLDKVKEIDKFLNKHSSMTFNDKTYDRISKLRGSGYNVSDDISKQVRIKASKPTQEDIKLVNEYNDALKNMIALSEKVAKIEATGGKFSNDKAKNSMVYDVQKAYDKLNEAHGTYKGDNKISNTQLEAYKQLTDIVKTFGVESKKSTEELTEEQKRLNKEITKTVNLRKELEAHTGSGGKYSSKDVADTKKKLFTDSLSSLTSASSSNEWLSRRLEEYGLNKDFTSMLSSVKYSDSTKELNNYHKALERVKKAEQEILDHQSKAIGGQGFEYSNIEQATKAVNRLKDAYTNLATAEQKLAESGWNGQFNAKKLSNITVDDVLVKEHKSSTDKQIDAQLKKFDELERRVKSSTSEEVSLALYSDKEYKKDKDKLDAIKKRLIELGTTLEQYRPNSNSLFSNVENYRKQRDDELNAAAIRTQRAMEAFFNSLDEKIKRILTEYRGQVVPNDGWKPSSRRMGIDALRAERAKDFGNEELKKEQIQWYRENIFDNIAISQELGSKSLKAQENIIRRMIESSKLESEEFNTWVKRLQDVLQKQNAVNEALNKALGITDSENAKMRTFAELAKQAQKNYELARNPTNRVSTADANKELANMVYYKQKDVELKLELNQTSYKDAVKELEKLAKIIQKVDKNAADLLKARADQYKKLVTTVDSGSNSSSSSRKTLAQREAEINRLMNRYAHIASREYDRTGGQATERFEKFKQKAIEAAEELIKIKKEMGKLSPATEEAIWTKLAWAHNKAVPLYNDLNKRIIQIRENLEKFNYNRMTPEQRAAYDRRHNASGQQLSVVGIGAGIIHFLGRSSKGFGSFGEAVADVISKMSTMGGALGKIAVPLAVFGAAIATVVNGLNMLWEVTSAFVGVITNLYTELYNALKPGIELFKQTTKAFYSMTAAIMNSGYLNGQKIGEVVGGQDTAKGMSKSIINRARLDAELSAFSFEEIMRSLAGTLPMLLEKGFSLDQAYKMNMGVAGVAKMTGLGPNQVLQEMRDLAQGSITSRASQVANTLGITNKDLEKFRGDADATFQFLTNRMEAFTNLLSEYENTVVGQFERLQDRWATTTEAIVEQLAPMFKGLFSYLVDLTGDYIDEAGNKLSYVWLDDGGRFDYWANQIEGIKHTEEELKEYGKQVKEILKYNAEHANEEGFVAQELPTLDGINLEKTGDAAFHLSNIMQQITDAIKEIILYTGQAADEIIRYATGATEGIDPITTIKNVILFIISCTVKLIKYCIDVVKWLLHHLSIVKLIWAGIKAILVLVGLLGAALGVVYEVCYAIGTGAIAIIAYGIKGVVNLGLKLGEVFLEVYKYCVAIGNALSKIKITWDSNKSVMENLAANKDNLSSISVGDEYEKLSKQYDTVGKKIDESLNAAIDNYLIKPAKEMFYGSIDEIFGIVNPQELEIEELGKDGDIYKALTELGDNLQVAAGDTSKVKGNPNPEKKDDKEAAKALKDAIKDSQKAWKEALEALKEKLDDIVNEIKEANDEIEVAYKRGLLTTEQYYAAKTALDREEKEQRLAEAKEEMVLLNNTMFENEYDKVKEQHKLQREINKLTRELGKSIRVQAFAARLMPQLTNALKTTTDALNKDDDTSNDLLTTRFGRYDDIDIPTVSAYQTPVEPKNEVNKYNDYQYVYEKVVKDYLGEGNQWIGDKLLNAAVKYSNMVDENLKDTFLKAVLYVAEVESHFNASAVSPAGAVGIMQLTPDTAQSLGVSDIFNIDQNIDAGVRLLASLLNEFKDIAKALAAYNAGPNAVYRYGGVPPYAETLNYVKQITGKIEWLNEAFRQAKGQQYNIKSENDDSNILYGIGGQVVGYIPRGDNNHDYGFDTRYLEFYDLRDEEYQKIHTDLRVIAAMNLAAQRYYNKFGKLLTITSLTGPADRSIHSSAPGGHHYGLKVDIAGDLLPEEREFVENLFRSIGAAIEFEKNHYDISFGEGGVYRTGADGLAFFNSAKFGSGNSSQVQSYGVQDVKNPNTAETLQDTRESQRKVLEEQLDFVHFIEERIKQIFDVSIDAGSMFKEYFSSADLNSDMEQIYEEAVSRLSDEISLKIEEQGYITGKHGAEIYKILVEALKELRGIKSESGRDSFRNLVTHRLYIQAVEIAKDNAELGKRRLEFQKDFTYAQLISGTLNPKDILPKYFGYYTNPDPKSPFGNQLPANVVETMRKLQVFGSSIGNISSFMELSDKIKEILQEARSVAEEFLSHRNSWWDFQGTNFELNERMTPLMQEYGEDELSAYRNQELFELLTVELESLEKQANITSEKIKVLNDWENYYSTKMDELTNKLKDLVEGTDEYNQVLDEQKRLVEENNKYSDPSNRANALLELTREQRQTLESLNSVEQQRYIAGIKSHFKNYFDRLHKTIRDTLEDSIVTFLTDGVNSGDIKEAARNFVLNILQAIQKVSAQAIAESISVMINGQHEVRKDQYIVNNDGVIKKVGETGQEIVAAIKESGTVIENGRQQDRVEDITTAKRNEEVNSQTAQATTEIDEKMDRDEDGDAISSSSSSDDGESTKSSSHFVNNGLGGNNKGYGNNFITKFMNNGFFNTIFSQIEGIVGSAMMQTVGSIYAIKTLFKGDTKEKLLSMIYLELQLIYFQLVNMTRLAGFSSGGIVKAFASGGLIKGPGTSTSDSIPAMLSDGEAVLNAKAVKKLGVNFINAVNEGHFSRVRTTLPKFANGGVLADARQTTARGVTDFASNVGTNVSTQNYTNIALVRDEREAMEHFMKSPQGQRIMVDFAKKNAQIYSAFS